MERERRASGFVQFLCRLATYAITRHAARHRTETLAQIPQVQQGPGFKYDFSQEPTRQGLYGYFDASFADCVDTRRSTVAYAFFFQGAVVSWKTRLYSFVTTSTNHSELVASAMAAREAKFLLLIQHSWFVSY